MTEPRRYGEDEVAEIFEAASAPVPASRRAASARGLTLSELQEIGREVGLPPERIAAAASSLDRSRNSTPRRTSMGMPVSAGRTVELARPLTDDEWALLVADLRETFRARGKEASSGHSRQWTNGNLHAFVEPTLDGYRLRLGTVKGDAAGVNVLGAGTLGMGVVAAAAGGEMMAFLALGGMGAGAFLFNALRLRFWARERDDQMEHIAERVRALLERDKPAPDRS